MGFFSVRKSIKLGPFGRMYLGKKGPSLSLGVRGAHVNFGSRGTRMTVGVPGSGISYSQKIGKSQRTTVAPAAVSSSSGCLVLFAVVVGLTIFVNFLQWSVAGTVVLCVVGAAFWYFISSKIAADDRRDAEEREAAERNRLAELYGEENVSLILLGKPWIGATQPMVVEMLGPPLGVDEGVIRTKTKHTYKYRQLGQNRFGLRVLLENGVVVGWDEKDEQ